MIDDRLKGLLTRHCHTPSARQTLLQTLEATQHATTTTQLSRATDKLPAWLIDVLSESDSSYLLASQQDVSKLIEHIMSIAIYSIHTAYAPTHAQLTELHSQLERVVDHPLLIEHIYAPEILGGFIIETPSGHRFSHTLTDLLTSTLSTLTTSS